MPNLIYTKLYSFLTYIPYYTALGFGIGLSPYMPGTLSTLLLGIPTYILMSHLTIYYYINIVFWGILLGIRICSIAEEILDKPDAPAIVWDEICGYWLTMLCAPAGTLWIILGFFLFRLFDILKPWPINIIQKNLHGGFGIMLDDIVAAIYSALIISLLTYFGIIVDAFSN